MSYEGAEPQAQPPSVSERSLAGRIVRFGLVGGSGVIVNLALLGLMVERLGWHTLAAGALAIEASTITNWLLNRSWTWRDRDQSAASILSYHGVSFVGLLAQWLVLAGATTLLGVHWLPASLAGVAVGAAWNFAANHHVTFQEYTPERRRKHVRVTLYVAAAALHVVLASLLAHDWDTFVFQKSVEQLLTDGATPYEVGYDKPDYAFVGTGLPVQALWYAYPPLPLLLMSLTYWPAALHLTSQPWIGRLLIHLPFVAGNLALAFTAHRFVRTSGEAGADRVRRAGRLEAFLLFNPLFIMVATIWGMFESVLLALLLASLLALRHGRTGRAGVLFGLATLIKIFPLYLAPLLAVWLTRRFGMRAAARYFAAGAATFAAISLPFFLLHPHGFLEQVVFMHSDRPPAHYSPFAFLYNSLGWLSSYAPNVIPPNAVLSQGLGMLSFITTGFVLLMIAAWSMTRPADEPNLLVAAAVSMTAGILATKVVSEQYSLLPLGLLLVAYHQSAWRWTASLAHRVKGVIVTVSIFLPVAALLNGPGALVFLPDDVATRVLGMSAPAAVASLASQAGLSVAELGHALSLIVALLLTVPFLNAVALAGPFIGKGFTATVHALHDVLVRIRMPWAAGPPRVALIVTLILMLAPTLTVGVLAPKQAPPGDDAGVVSGTLVLMDYRPDWVNPTHRFDVAAGTWRDAVLVPADGYYSVNSHKASYDLRTFEAAGIDGIVLRFPPNYESQASAVGAVADSLGYPYALEVDLAYVADDEEGLVPITARTAERARELLDGPGLDYWQSGHHLRFNADGGYVVFLAGADLVTPAFTEEERRWVAEHHPDLQGSGRDATTAIQTDGPLWRQAPTTAAELAAATPDAYAWRVAYANATAQWWQRFWSPADSRAMDLIVETDPPLPRDPDRDVTIVGHYEPRFTAPATVPVEGGVAFYAVPSDPANDKEFEDAWHLARAHEGAGVLLPWNHFDTGHAVEPTLATGGILFERARQWTAAFHNGTVPTEATAPPAPAIPVGNLTA